MLGWKQCSTVLVGKHRLMWIDMLLVVLQHLGRLYNQQLKLGAADNITLLL